MSDGEGRDEDALIEKRVEYRRPPPRVCPFCGLEFEVACNRRGRRPKYCSVACRVAYYRRGGALQPQPGAYYNATK